MRLKYAHQPMRMELICRLFRRLKINVSQVCDSHLREVVRREEARRWRQEHADFIAAYNATVEAEGLPLDEWRTF